MNEVNGSSDGKPFRRQIVSFRPPISSASEASFYGTVEYPSDVPDDFDVLRVNEIVIDGTTRQRLIDANNVWMTNNGKVRRKNPYISVYCQFEK